jgi:heme exporter protein B
MRRLFLAVLRRDLRLAARRRLDVLLPLAFLVVSVTLFPLGVGPEPAVLREIAPGVVWACALLSALLAVQSMYVADLADGSLEQLLLADRHALALVAAKALAHWLTTGAPLLVAAPVLGAALGLPGDALAALVASLAIGTPALSLLGGLGAALTLGLRGGAILLVVIVLPLATPVLIFGAGAVVAHEAGVAIGGHLSLLGAAALFALLFAPPASAAALRIAVE